MAGRFCGWNRSSTIVSAAPCDKVAVCYVQWPTSGIEWFCAEHYDRIARLFEAQPMDYSQDDQTVFDMACKRLNGW